MKMVFLSLLLFYIGIVAHEYIHILQLKKAGYRDYKVMWLFVFPVGIKFRYHYFNPLNLLTWEIVPTIITLICWYLAYVLW